MPYNRADAMIHFVDEGMMLVSPVIFRKFAELFGEEGDGTPSDRAGSKLGTGIQRQVETAGDAEVPSSRIGEMVMDGLRQIDSVAYIRFASVYRDFSEAKDFEEFASTVQEAARDGAD